MHARAGSERSAAACCRASSTCKECETAFSSPYCHKTPVFRHNDWYVPPHPLPTALSPSLPRTCTTIYLGTIHTRSSAAESSVRDGAEGLGGEGLSVLRLALGCGAVPGKRFPVRGQCDLFPGLECQVPGE